MIKMDLSTISNDISTNNITFDHSQLVEQLNQQLHSVNQQLETKTLLNKEMELEIERLQCIIDYNTNNAQLEKSELTKQFNEKINSLHCLLEEERKQAINDIAELKENIGTAKSHIVEEAISTKENVLEDQILSLKDKITELKKQLAESKDIIHNTEFINSQLVEKSKELMEQLEATKEILKIKTDLLKSTVEAFEELKEEKALIANELAILKACPLENNDRGNSLFSEVDIKRQAIQNKLDMVHSKYLQAKRILAIKSNEMEKLKAENRKIQMFWDEEVSKVKRREQTLLESYRRTNDELRILIAKLELRPETPQIVTISDVDMSSMQWIHTVIDNARAEAKELRNSYETKSCELLLIEENMYAISMEIKDLKKQSIKDKALIDELKSKLATLENPDNTITPDETNSVKKDSPKEQEKKYMSNGVTSSKVVRFAEDKKEL